MAKNDGNDDAGASDVQNAFDDADERGYFGAETDPTPNSAYTLSGVTSGEPTPETDDDAAAAADERQSDLANVEPTGDEQ